VNAVVEQPTVPAVIDAAASPYMQTIQLMLQRGAEVDKLERLFDLQIKWEQNEARKAYIAALAELKKNVHIEILKRKRADIPGGAKYQYADLAEVCDAAIGPMGQFGFTHRWKTEQDDDRDRIKITCILTHAQGHSEEAYLYGPPDDSGKKSPIQQVISTVSYLERVTMLAVLGLAAKGMDNDGAGRKQEAPPAEVPNGYENWKADMTARADEGLRKLTDTWSASDGAYRRHVIKYDEAWWSETKAKAVQADKKAKAAQDAAPSEGTT
jgi:hypothetical protein